MQEYLRIVATFGEDTGRLTNFKLVKEENDNDELLWDCLATGTARVVEDGSVLSPVENEMCVPFLLAAPAKPPEGREDEEQLKPDVVAVVGVALPNLAIAEGEGEGESEPAKVWSPRVLCLLSYLSLECFGAPLGVLSLHAPSAWIHVPAHMLRPPCVLRCSVSLIRLWSSPLPLPPRRTATSWTRRS